MYWQLHKFELSVCIFCNIFYERINMKPVGMLKQTFNECIAIDWHYNFRPFQTNYIFYPLRFTKKTPHSHLHWDSTKTSSFCNISLRLTKIQPHTQFSRLHSPGPPKSTCSARSHHQLHYTITEAHQNNYTTLHSIAAHNIGHDIPDLNYGY